MNKKIVEAVENFLDLVSRIDEVSNQQYEQDSRNIKVVQANQKARERWGISDEGV